MWLLGSRQWSGSSLRGLIEPAVIVSEVAKQRDVFFSPGELHRKAFNCHHDLSKKALVLVGMIRT